MAETQTKKKRVDEQLMAQHEAMAAESFAKHVVTQRLDQGLFRSWRCKRPDSWCMGFDITTTPGYLIVTGDIGELILSRCDDMVPWARGAVGSPDYFAEKVVRTIKTEEWSNERALEWIDDEIADAQREAEDEDEAPRAAGRLKRLKVLRYEATRDGINGALCEGEFAIALYESELVHGSDWPRLTVFNSNFLWCLMAVRWWLKAIDSLPAAPEVTT